MVVVGVLVGVLGVVVVAAGVWSVIWSVVWRGETLPAELPPLLDRALRLARVAVLMVMHLASALVTYNCLVHIASVKPTTARSHARPPASDTDRFVRCGS